MGSCSPMILVKNFEFTLRSFFFKIGLDKPFDYVQHRKQGFVDQKNDMTENCRNFHFSKGVNPWIWSKILKFSLSLFFLKIGLDKLYEYIRHRKQGFVDYKNDIRAKSKNCHFFKGVNPLFWTKFEIPSHFVLSLKFS